MEFRSSATQKDTEYYCLNLDLAAFPFRRDY